MLDLTNRLREYQSLTASQRAALAALPPPPSAVGTPQGLELPLNQRVLDLVTGIEGIIEDGTANHIIVAG